MCTWKRPMEEKKIIEEREEQWNVLILGDGNFSFSTAYCHELCGRFLVKDERKAKTVNIFCTSFDSASAIKQKYPDSDYFLRSLKKWPQHVSIIHDIDATKLNNMKFYNPENHLVVDEFHEIIFNFPHLGFEDIHMHRSFMAHLFESVKSKLLPKGTFILSLAQSQKVGWRIAETALRLDLDLIEAIPLVLQCWPQYELKRHHIGKSFQSRVQDCFHYIFRRKNTKAEEIFEKSYFQKIYDLFYLSTLSEVGKSLSDEKAVTIPTPIALDRKKSKKRKVHELVEGHFQEIMTPLEPGKQYYLCNFCSKSFPTRQGITTHVYNVHLLSTTTPASSTSEITCELCGKCCSNADAYYQHRLAKHEGKYDVSQTPTIGEEPRSPEEVTTSRDKHFECTICLLRFTTEESLNYHYQHGFEPQNIYETYPCDYCQRICSNHRAWRQHMNFCRTKVNLGK